MNRIRVENIAGMEIIIGGILLPFVKPYVVDIFRTSGTEIA